MRTKSAYTENDIVNVSFTRSIRTGHCNALIERRIATMTSPKGELGQSRRLSIIIIDYYIVKIYVFNCYDIRKLIPFSIFAKWWIEKDGTHSLFRAVAITEKCTRAHSDKVLQRHCQAISPSNYLTNSGGYRVCLARSSRGDNEDCNSDVTRRGAGGWRGRSRAPVHCSFSIIV